jgi:hypothetical protein
MAMVMPADAIAAPTAVNPNMMSLRCMVKMLFA